MKQLALVTGGNRGIGRGIVLALARRGFDIVFVDVAETEDSALTRQQAERDGARVAFVAADIADLAQHPRIVESAYAHGGRLDLLVNNAGVSVARRGDVLEVTPESFDRVMGINLRGTFFLSQAAARRMVADPAEAQPRAIVTISSANAVMASICAAGCNCSASTLDNVSAGMIADPTLVYSTALPGERPSSVKTNRPSRSHGKNGISAHARRSPLI